MESQSGMACLARPRGPEERKPQNPTKWVPGGKLQPFSEAFSPPSQDKAVAKPSGPSLRPWQREGAGGGGGRRRTLPGSASCHLGSVSIPLLGHSRVSRAPPMLTPTQTDTGGLWGCPVLGLSPPTPEDCGRWLSLPGDPNLITKVHAWLCCSSSCARISWV